MDLELTVVPTIASHGSSYPHTDLGPEVVQQVRSLLAQGYKIGTEHAGPRRFKTGSWKSCAPIETTDEAKVLTELQACIANHEGEYVRLIGIDPNAKRRVLETIIERPGEQKQKTTARSSGVTAYSNTAIASNGSSYPHTDLGPEVVQQVRSLLAQGYKIGTEHADPRPLQNQLLEELCAI